MATGAVATAGYAWRLGYFDPPVEAQLTPPEALERVKAGELLLIDIRRPDEWARTGVPAGAAPLDMRRSDFVPALQALMQDDDRIPVAIICARGVRSRRVSNLLEQAGFTQIIDIPEGMLGSKAGPGWVARGLPVDPPPAAS